jgi:GTPase
MVIFKIILIIMLSEEVRIAIAGSVDVGKSSLIGVLTRDILDDGRGLARAHVFKFRHEKESGRTSSITNHYIKHANSDKVTTLIDLAGHEKYLKTTINGLERGLADYVAIIIGANNGILKMTKEHLTVAFALEIPTFLIITKIDMAPAHILKQTEDDIIKLFSGRVNKAPIFIKSMSDLELFTDRTKQIPVIEISSVTGVGLDVLKRYLYSLSWIIDYPIVMRNRSPVFIIDASYSIKGIGLVVSGVVKYGRIARGDTLFIGPFYQSSATSGGFLEVNIRGIHDNFKTPIDSLVAGYAGCLNIKPLQQKVTIKRSTIRNGAVVIKEPRYIREFTANIKVLHHSTTIKSNYQPMIHCNGSSQCAKIVAMDKEFLRNGDTAIVTFRYLYKPTFIEIGNILIFREGNTKGIGRIIENGKTEEDK